MNQKVRAMMKKWPTGAIPRLSDVMGDDIKGFSRDTEPSFLDSLDSILIFTGGLRMCII